MFVCTVVKVLHVLFGVWRFIHIFSSLDVVKSIHNRSMGNGHVCVCLVSLTLLRLGSTMKCVLRGNQFRSNRGMFLLIIEETTNR